MSNQYKVGIVAIARFVQQICQVITRFNAPLRVAITRAGTLGIISTAEAVQANNFLDTSTAVCAIFNTMAEHWPF